MPGMVSQVGQERPAAKKAARHRIGSATPAPMLNKTLIRFPYHAASGGEQRVGETTMIWVSDAYYARFGNFPPVLYWRGTVKGLQVLMMQALERGTPLTADELMKVQGHSEPPPEAKM